MTKKGKSRGIRGDIKPAKNDVLLGRGHPYYTHNRNTVWRKLILKNFMEYNEGGLRPSQTRPFATVIVTQVYQQHGRFLRMVKGNWKQATQKEAEDKTMQALRDEYDLFKKRKDDTKSTPAVNVTPAATVTPVKETEVQAPKDHYPPALAGMEPTPKRLAYAEPPAIAQWKIFPRYYNQQLRSRTSTPNLPLHDKGERKRTLFTNRPSVQATVNLPPASRYKRRQWQSTTIIPKFPPCIPQQGHHQQRSVVPENVTLNTINRERQSAFGTNATANRREQLLTNHVDLYQHDEERQGAFGTNATAWQDGWTNNGGIQLPTNHVNLVQHNDGSQGTFDTSATTWQDGWVTNGGARLENNTLTMTNDTERRGVTNMDASRPQDGLFTNHPHLSTIGTERWGAHDTNPARQQELVVTNVSDPRENNAQIVTAVTNMNAPRELEMLLCNEVDLSSFDEDMQNACDTSTAGQHEGRPTDGRGIRPGGSTKKARIMARAMRQDAAGGDFNPREHDAAARTGASDAFAARRQEQLDANGRSDRNGIIARNFSNFLTNYARQHAYGLEVAGEGQDTQESSHPAMQGQAQRATTVDNPRPRRMSPLTIGPSFISAQEQANEDSQDVQNLRQLATVPGSQNENPGEESPDPNLTLEDGINLFLENTLRPLPQRVKELENLYGIVLPQDSLAVSGNSLDLLGTLPRRVKVIEDTVGFPSRNNACDEHSNVLGAIHDLLGRVEELEALKHGIQI